MPNYQGGRDATAGFKHHFKGEVLDEIYVKLNQLDFAAELTRIRALEPDAVLVFMPSGMGVSLLCRIRQEFADGDAPAACDWQSRSSCPSPAAPPHCRGSAAPAD